MLGRRHELLGEPTVSDQYETDHGLLRKSGRLAIDVRVGVGVSRCLTTTVQPASRRRAANASATTIERCRPPVQPNAMVR